MLEQEFSRFPHLRFGYRVQSDLTGVEAYSFNPQGSRNGVLSLDHLADLVKVGNLSKVKLGENTEFYAYYNPRAKHFVFRVKTPVGG